jgi:hypothetical protein
MSDNKLKTTFIFSSLDAKTVITGMAKDEATLTHRSISGCLEEHMLYSPLMPELREAQIWLCALYTGEWTLEQTLGTCFSFLAAGPNGYDSKDTKALAPLCNFCRAFLMPGDFPRIDESAVSYIVSQADTVASILEAAAKNSDLYSGDYQLEAKHIRRLCETLQQNTTAFSALDIYETVGAYHSILSGNSRTYRLMSALCSHVTFRNNEHSRYEFAELLRRLSKDWG